MYKLGHLSLSLRRLRPSVSISHLHKKKVIPPGLCLFTTRRLQEERGEKLSSIYRPLRAVRDPHKSVVKQISPAAHFSFYVPAIFVFGLFPPSKKIADLSAADPEQRLVGVRSRRWPCSICTNGA